MRLVSGDAEGPVYPVPCYSSDRMSESRPVGEMSVRKLECNRATMVVASGGGGRRRLVVLERVSKRVEGSSPTGEVQLTQRLQFTADRTPLVSPPGGELCPVREAEKCHEEGKPTRQQTPEDAAAKRYRAPSSSPPPGTPPQTVTSDPVANAISAAMVPPVILLIDTFL